MVSKSEMYMLVILILCSIFAIININYYNNPDGMLDDLLSQGSETDKANAIKKVNEIIKNYDQVYNLSVAILALFGVILVVLVLKYAGITHKLLSVLVILCKVGIVILSLIIFIYGIFIGTVDADWKRRYGQFWSRSFMGISPVICGGLGLLLAPSIYVYLKHM